MRLLGLFVGFLLIALAFLLYLQSGIYVGLCGLVSVQSNVRGSVCVDDGTRCLISLLLGVVGGLVFGGSLTSNDEESKDREGGEIRFGDGEKGRVP
jgi:hypothetical protein